MTDYDLFAKHYDTVMGDRSENAELLQRFIHQYHPKAKSILELACGTGAVLQHFTKQYELSGLDLSSSMLSLAKKTVPSGTFLKQNMLRFRIDKKFDVILCVFDSINHLLIFSDWQKVFQRAYQHLNSGGIFIFDMNTRRKLQRHINEQPWVLPFEKHLLVMDVQNAGNGISNWNVKVFEHKNKNRYELYEENIREKAFPLSQVKGALKSFQNIHVIDTDRKHPSTKSERVTFICKKK